jgi:integrase
LKRGRRLLCVHPCRWLAVARSASKVNSRSVIGTTKTHQARTVAVPVSVLKMLTPLMVGKSPDELLWCRADGQPLRPPTTSHWFGAAVRRCQVNDPTFPRVTVHEMRHTAASLLIQSGANVKTVQRQLGHKTATMTLDQYGHLFDDDLDDVADKMDDIVAEGGCAQNVPNSLRLDD